ncbi:MAG: response regulator, partial [Candidatus Omnitrophota bacterium]
MTTLTGGLPQAFASAGVFDPAGGVKAQTQLLKDLYAMPAELGSLVSSWKPPAGTSHRSFVVHIQDAHANPEAQQNISEILKFLAKKYPDLAIGIEGAAGPLHPEYLQFFHEFPEASQAVIEDLRQKGELGGAELFAWGKFQDLQDAPQSISGQDVEKAKSGDAVIPVRGVENAELYRENLKTYRELLFSRDEIQARLTPLRARFQTEISRTLNANLRDFLNERDRRKEGRYAPDRVSGGPNLQAYVLYLKKEALKFLKIDLKDPLEQLRFPNLVRIILAGEVQKGLDDTKVREDWKNVLASLKAVATKNADLEFVSALSSFGLGKGFLTEPQGGAPVPATVDAALYPRKLLEQLFLFTKKHSLAFTGHDSFFKSLEPVIFQAEMEAAGLLQEMNSLETLLTEKLARTDAEKKLVRRLQVFHLFEKLLFLELTREEYERSEAERGDLEAFVEGAPELRNFLERAKHFYATALQRDRALMENALALGGTSPKERQRIVVLITGGFHTGGIDTLLREQKISYATLTPHISRTDRGELYQKVMAGDHADLSAYFKVKNPFSTKQEALFFKELLETAAPVLFEKYKMEPARIASAVAQAANSHPVLSGAVEASSLAGDGKPALRFIPRMLTPQNTAIAAPANTAETSFLRSLTEDQTRETSVPMTVEFGAAKALTLSVRQDITGPEVAPAVSAPDTARSKSRGDAGLLQNVQQPSLSGFSGGWFLTVWPDGGDMVKEVKDVLGDVLPISEEERQEIARRLVAAHQKMHDDGFPVLTVRLESPTRIRQRKAKGFMLSELIERFGTGSPQVNRAYRSYREWYTAAKERYRTLFFFDAKESNATYDGQGELKEWFDPVIPVSDSVYLQIRTMREHGLVRDGGTRSAENKRSEMREGDRAVEPGEARTPKALKWFSPLRIGWNIWQGSARDRELSRQLGVKLTTRAAGLYYFLIELFEITPEESHAKGFDRLFWLWSQYMMVGDDLLDRFGSRLSIDEMTEILAGADHTRRIDLRLHSKVGAEELRASPFSAVFPSDSRDGLQIINSFPERFEQALLSTPLDEKEREVVRDAFWQNSRLFLHSYLLERKTGLFPSFQGTREIFTEKDDFRPLIQIAASVFQKLDPVQLRVRESLLHGVAIFCQHLDDWMDYFQDFGIQPNLLLALANERHPEEFQKLSDWAASRSEASLAAVNGALIWFAPKTTREYLSMTRLAFEQASHTQRSIPQFMSAYILFRYLLKILSNGHIHRTIAGHGTTAGTFSVALGTRPATRSEVREGERPVDADVVEWVRAHDEGHQLGVWYRASARTIWVESPDSSVTYYKITFPDSMPQEEISGYRERLLKALQIVSKPYDSEGWGYDKEEITRIANAALSEVISGGAVVNQGLLFGGLTDTSAAGAARSEVRREQTGQGGWFDRTVAWLQRKADRAPERINPRNYPGRYDALINYLEHQSHVPLSSLKGKSVVDGGSSRGYATLDLAQRLAELGTGVRVYGVDPGEHGGQIEGADPDSLRRDLNLEFIQDDHRLMQAGSAIKGIKIFLSFNVLNHYDRRTLWPMIEQMAEKIENRGLLVIGSGGPQDIVQDLDTQEELIAFDPVDHDSQFLVFQKTDTGLVIRELVFRGLKDDSDRLSRWIPYLGPLWSRDLKAPFQRLDEEMEDVKQRVSKKFWHYDPDVIKEHRPEEERMIHDAKLKHLKKLHPGVKELSDGTVILPLLPLIFRYEPERGFFGRIFRGKALAFLMLGLGAEVFDHAQRGSRNRTEPNIDEDQGDHRSEMRNNAQLEAGAEDVRSEMRSPDNGTPKKTEQFLKGRKILHVDNDPDDRELVKSSLEVFGAEVISVAKGSEALKILEKENIDALVADAHMPEMTGAELIRQIQQKGLKVKSIMATREDRAGRNNLFWELEAKIPVVTKYGIIKALRELFDPGIKSALEMKRSEARGNSGIMTERFAALMDPVKRTQMGVSKIIFSIGPGDGQFEAALARDPRYVVVAADPYGREYPGYHWGFLDHSLAIQREAVLRDNLVLFNADFEKILKDVPDGMLDAIVLLHPEPEPLAKFLADPGYIAKLKMGGKVYIKPYHLAIYHSDAIKALQKDRGYQQQKGSFLFSVDVNKSFRENTPFYIFKKSTDGIPATDLLDENVTNLPAALIARNGLFRGLPAEQKDLLERMLNYFPPLDISRGIHGALAEVLKRGNLSGVALQQEVGLALARLMAEQIKSRAVVEASLGRRRAEMRTAPGGTGLARRGRGDSDAGSELHLPVIGDAPSLRSSKRGLPDVEGQERERRDEDRRGSSKIRGNSREPEAEEASLGYRRAEMRDNSQSSDGAMRDQERPDIDRLTNEDVVKALSIKVKKKVILDTGKADYVARWLLDKESSEMLPTNVLQDVFYYIVRVRAQNRADEILLRLISRKLQRVLNISEEQTVSLFDWLRDYDVFLRGISPAVFEDFFKTYSRHYRMDRKPETRFFYNLPQGIDSEAKIVMATRNMKRMESLFSPGFLTRQFVLAAHIEGTPYLLGMRYGSVKGSSGVSVFLDKVASGRTQRIYHIALDTQLTQGGEALRIVMMNGVRGQENEIKHIFPGEFGFRPGVALLHVALALAQKEDFGALMGIKAEYIPYQKNMEANVAASYDRLKLTEGRGKGEYARWKKVSDLLEKVLPALKERFGKGMQRMTAAFENLEAIKLDQLDDFIKKEFPANGPQVEVKRSEVRIEEKVIDVTTMTPGALENLRALTERGFLEGGQPISMGLLTRSYEMPVVLPELELAGRRNFLKMAGMVGVFGAVWLALGGATTFAGQVRKPAAAARPSGTVSTDAASQAMRVMNQVRYATSLEPLQFNDWNGTKGNVIATVLGELNSFAEQWKRMPKQDVAPEKLGEMHRAFFQNLAQRINSGIRFPEGYGLDYVRAAARLIHKDLPQFFAAQGLVFNVKGVSVENLTMQVTQGGKVVRSQDYFYPMLTMPDKYFFVLKANARRDLKMPPQVLGDERTPLILVQPVRIQIGGGQVRFSPYAEQWREGQRNELGFADGVTAFLRADFIEQALKYDRASLEKVDLGFLAEDLSLRDVITGVRVGEPTVTQGKKTIRVISFPVTNLNATVEYAAMKLMVAAIRSLDKGKTVFDFGLWHLARYLETAKHEITHVNDSHRVVWRTLWQMIQPASDRQVPRKDIDDAERLIEQNARLEAFKEVPAVYLVSLLATIQSEIWPVLNSDKAQADILAAVSKELNRNPIRYGIDVVETGLKVEVLQKPKPGEKVSSRAAVTLDKNTQIMAQFYRIAEKSDRVEALYTAVREALNIDARAQALAAKYAFLDPGAPSSGRSEMRQDRQPLEKPIEKILVVDDEVAMATIATRVLMRAGFKVTMVHSGEDALEKLKEFMPDAILTDVR